jgi:hypothetical protein
MCLKVCLQLCVGSQCLVVNEYILCHLPGKIEVLEGMAAQCSKHDTVVPVSHLQYPLRLLPSSENGRHLCQRHP